MDTGLNAAWAFNRLTLRQWVLLAAPFLLTASMYGFYVWFDAQMGYPLGYLLAFCVYWFGWCIFFPAVLLGGFRQLLGLFRPFPAFSRLGWKTHLLLWWPVIFPLAFIFIPRLTTLNLGILLLSLLIGFLIGMTEEIFWRGLFYRFFPRSAWVNLAFAPLLFGIWHIAPQAARPSSMPGGVYSFVFYAVVLGISYAIATRRTKSIGWATVSHVVHDTLGLGGLAYVAWLGWM
jgi:uncharacterized protein